MSNITNDVATISILSNIKNKKSSIVKNDVLNKKDIRNEKNYCIAAVRYNTIGNAYRALKTDDVYLVKEDKSSNSKIRAYSRCSKTIQKGEKYCHLHCRMTKYNNEGLKIFNKDILPLNSNDKTRWLANIDDEFFENMGKRGAKKKYCNNFYTFKNENNPVLLVLNHKNAKLAVQLELYASQLLKNNNVIYNDSISDVNKKNIKSKDESLNNITNLISMITSIQDKSKNHTNIVNQTMDEDESEEDKSKDDESKDAKSKVAKSKDAKSKDAKSKDAKSKDPKSKDAKSKDAESEEDESEEDESEEDESEENESEEDESEDAESEDAESEDAKSEEDESEDAESEDAESEDAESEDAKSEDAKSEDAESEDAKSKDAKSKKDESEDAKSEEDESNKVSFDELDEVDDDDGSVSCIPIYTNSEQLLWYNVDNKTIYLPDGEDGGEEIGILTEILNKYHTIKYDDKFYTVLKEVYVKDKGKVFCCVLTDSLFNESLDFIGTRIKITNNNFQFEFTK